VGPGPRRRRIAVVVTGVLLAACAPRQRASEPAQGAVELPTSTEPGGWRLSSGAALGERNRCVDRELRARGLNEFGDPEGTTYAAGQPLGVTATTDRVEYVLQRRPEIRSACTPLPAPR
jgi:hypothetical protein